MQVIYHRQNVENPRNVNSAIVMLNDHKIKHLELIQKVIERMARNSFMYKGWALSIFAAFLLLPTKYCGVVQLFGIAPLFGFWIFDAYYLRQERLFRLLYNDVRLSNKDADFSMSTKPFEKLVDAWIWVMKSKTIVWFYLLMIVAIIVEYYVVR